MQIHIWCKWSFQWSIIHPFPLHDRGSNSFNQVVQWPPRKTLLNQRGRCFPQLLTGPALSRGCCLGVVTLVVGPTHDHQTCQYGHWLTSLLGRFYEGGRDSDWHPQIGYLILLFAEIHLRGSCCVESISKGPISSRYVFLESPFKCFFLRATSHWFSFSFVPSSWHPVEPLAVTSASYLGMTSVPYLGIAACRRSEHAWEDLLSHCPCGHSQVGL